MSNKSFQLPSSSLLDSDGGFVDVVAVVGEDGLSRIGTKEASMIASVATVSPTLTVAGAYTANDFVGTSTTAMTFLNCAREVGGKGIIQAALLIDKAAASASGELWLFDSAPTPPSDNAAWSISDADVAKCIGVIAFSTYYASAINSVSIVANVGIPFACGAAVSSLYGCFVTRGTPTYATGDVSFRLSILQD
jgi:hypothetical protein